MENMKNNEALESVREKLKEEIKRAKDEKLADKGNTEAIDDGVYRDACSYLGDEILDPKLLFSTIQYISRNWNEMRRKYAPGDKCCLTVIPVTDEGGDFSEYHIKKDAYLRLVYESKTDGLTRDFTMYPSRLLELLPKYIRENCSFVFPEEDSKDFNKARNEFLRLYKDKFNNLRVFLGLKPIEETLH